MPLNFVPPASSIYNGMQGRIIFRFIKSRTAPLPYPHRTHTLTANHYGPIIQLAELEMHCSEYQGLETNMQ